MEQNIKNWNFKSKELEFLFKEIYLQLKTNPNNFIIINKWNKKIFDKYRQRLYFALEEELKLRFNQKKANFLTK